MLFTLLVLGILLTATPALSASVTVIFTTTSEEDTTIAQDRGSATVDTYLLGLLRARLARRTVARLENERRVLLQSYNALSAQQRSQLRTDAKTRVGSP